MSERDLTAIDRDRIAEWDGASVGRAERAGEPARAAASPAGSRRRHRGARSRAGRRILTRARPTSSTARTRRAGPHGRRRSRAGSPSRAACASRRRRRRRRPPRWPPGECSRWRPTIWASRRRRPARRPRSRRPGGRWACGWRTGFTVWSRAAACTGSRSCAGFLTRASVAVRGVVDRAPHGRHGAGRARGGLVAHPVPARQLVRAQLLPRDGLRLPARRRHRRADLDRGRGRHVARSVSRTRSASSSTAPRCWRSITRC